MQEVFAWIGAFDASVGDVLDAQHKCVAALCVQPQARARVRGEVVAGAHFAAAVGVVPVGERKADAQVKKPARGGRWAEYYGG